MDEPSYQSSGPSRQVVYTDISDSIQYSREWKKLIQMNQRLPYRILDIGNISLIIKECIGEFVNKCERMMWYFTSTRYSLLTVVKKKIHEYYRKKATTILTNSFIIDNWINQVLYSPGGIRYKIHKTSFQNLAGDYKG